MTQPSAGLETLLELDGSVFEQEAGFWIKIEAKKVTPSVAIPHGIKYSLTLHDRKGARVLGYDNAHGLDPSGKRFKGRRLVYDHKHRTATDKGVSYSFATPQQLLQDFFAECDRVIGAAKEPGMKKIVIGVMPQKQIRERALAIARGDYKPKPGEPKVWFTSMKSVAEVLSDSNRALLKVIRETEPQSVAELAKATGRQRSNLSRTLKTMSRYGLVDLRREKKSIRPIVKASDFQIQASA